MGQMITPLPVLPPSQQANPAADVPGGPRPHLADSQRREIIRALSRSNSLAALIADPNQFDLRQACRVTKIALEEDTDFDKKLVELVKSQTVSAPDHIIRVLAVLDAVCLPSRLLGHVLELRHLEGRVRSKLTLMIARLTRDPEWLRQQLQDDSPRIRANTIEGLWDVRAQGLEDLLRAALRDPHHRVAANSALALYKIGDPSTIETFYSLLQHSDELFRRAGLWAVGQTRDPRFLTAVEQLLPSLSGEELELAQGVRDELRSARASLEFTSLLSLELSRDKTDGAGDRKIRLCCLAESVGGWLTQNELSGVNFTIYHGERQVQKYNFKWAGHDEAFIALVVVPRAWNGKWELLKPALRGAGSNEVYGFLPYQTAYSAVRGKEKDDRCEIKFENFLDLSREYLGRAYEVARSFDYAVAAGLSALQELGGTRHLFLLADPSIADAGAMASLRAAEYRDIKIHALVWDGATPEFSASTEQLVRASGGQFLRSSSARDFTRLMLSARAQQFGAFELSWTTPVSADKNALIVCSSDYGYGELVLPKRSE